MVLFVSIATIVACFVVVSISMRREFSGKLIIIIIMIIMIIFTVIIFLCIFNKEILHLQCNMELRYTASRARRQ